MGIFTKFIDGLRSKNNDDDDYYYDDDEYFGEEEEETSHNQKPSKLNGLFQKKVIDGGKGMEVITIKPQNRQDSNNIVDALLDGKAVVINMVGLPLDLAQRMIDYTQGAVYAIGGDLQTISDYIFIATSNNIELQGEYENSEEETETAPYYQANKTKASNGGFRFNN
ncbi:MAG: cell division protein SepF [Eubacteriales bacterium]|nr:cell division protein SepF [Eubacteriales bacterium]